MLKEYADCTVTAGPLEKFLAEDLVNVPAGSWDVAVHATQSPGERFLRC